MRLRVTVCDSLRHATELLLCRPPLCIRKSEAEAIRTLHGAHAKFRFIRRAGRVAGNNNFIAVAQRVVLNAAVGQLCRAGTFDSPTDLLAVLIRNFNRDERMRVAELKYYDLALDLDCP